MRKSCAFCLIILPLSFLTWFLLVWSDCSLAVARLKDGAGDRPPALITARNDSPNSAGDVPDSSNLMLVTPLLGHWMTADGMTHYYLGQDQLIEINLLQSQERSPIFHKQKLSYEVLAPDQANSSVRLQIETPLGLTQVRRLHLAADRLTLTEMIDLMGHSFRNRWIYVDDRQQP